ncbi:Rrf2 family transcriptional regulator [Nitratireductor aquimarinus]|uniref:Rrf2 family transcriptional regulator n=1 Tax=Nitratireductor aquimarinus TaxID=889300 RepID=A0ABU4AFR0_9HYPH|nr:MULTISPECIES: Rrf2 family transcriptional regulator [Nitratireductor]MBN7762898.1 Rrf2 family transcriptional regulator [Nitratireductor aquibiodomus]MBN7774863.1 Rrf2 family transcriptional regulator [Nitratireductor pacificus]MBN7779724.1 Rrf2 family transcriptional regulator [Nitratireductor pacificus]MBN7788531.1 Rrf2 family transcriptional regulator [Nitratireductor aquimarinus]MBN8242789.1 Rrf2 family transcriptional regulator [Nitratireductor aquimarinus]
MKLSEGVEAAIHCATLLAQLEEGRTMPASALAEYHGLSPSYLLKHLKTLTAARILESVSGPHGGYRLARSADAITLLDVVLAIEGPQPAFRCAEIRQRGPGALEPEVYAAPCNINAAMLRAEQAYRAELRKTRLSDVISDYLGEADPRALAFSCAFVARNQRPQG